MSAAPEPVAREDRIGLLDALRGIAVFGILLMNIVGYGLPYAYEDPTNWGGSSGANLLFWRLDTLLFEGTMRGLFTLLFGAGALLFLQRHAQQSGPARARGLYLRRTLWLIVFGLINGYLLLWDGDILFYYGVTGLLLALPFHRLSPTRLIALAALIMSLQTLVTIVEWADYGATRSAAHAAEAKRFAGEPLDLEDLRALDAYAVLNSEFKPAKRDLQSMVAGMRASYASAFHIVQERTWYVQTMFFPRHGLLESLGMMLLGMALLKLGVLDGTAPARTYLGLIASGYMLGLAVNLQEMRLLESSGFATGALIDSYLTYDLGRIPMTLGHVGTIGWLSRTGSLQGVLRRIAYVGQMALTNYLAHSVICMLLFTGAGMALYGQLERSELYYAVIAIWIVQAVWSQLWLRRFRFGPAEWLWRSLTYGRWQPLRRAAVPRRRAAET